MTPSHLARILPHKTWSFALLPLLFSFRCSAQVWTSVGPAPIAGSTGPTGRITSLAIDPSNPNHWLLGSAGGGIWTSSDAGAAWTPLTDGQASLSIGSMAIAASNPQVIYGGTGEATYTGHAQAGQGILKSTDGGTIWTLMGAATFARTAIGAIRVNQSNPNTLVAVMSRANAGRDSEPFLGPYPPPFGVQRSTDGGVSWTLTLAGETTSLEVDPNNFNNQFTAISLPAGYGPYNSPAATGVYRSADGGQTWTLIPGPWAVQSIGRILVALAPSNPNTLYVSVQGSNQHLLGLYRTDNALSAAPTWIAVSTAGNWATLGANYPDYCGNSCTTADLIAVDPSDPNTLYAGGVSLWRCSACGASPAWTDVGFTAQVQGNLPSGKRCLSWSGSLLVACTDGGVFSTANGVVPWQDRNGGLSVARLVSGAPDQTTPKHALAGAFDNASVLWTGAFEWQSLGTGNAEVALSGSVPNNMMVSAGQVIFRSTNGGVSFVGANNGFIQAAPGLANFLEVRKCPAVDDIFLAGTNLLQRTNGFFSSATPSWIANGPSGAAVTAIAFAESDPKCNTYAYGTASGQVFITLNGGSTWSSLDPKGNLPGRAVNSLAFDPSSAQIVYAALGGFNAGTAISGHLFKTGNALSGAPMWSNMGLLADLPFNVVAIDPANSNSVFVGTDAAVWHSSNGGSGWQFLGPVTGLPNVPVYDLKFSPANGQLLAFTFGRGAWVLDTTATPPSGPLVSLSANAALQSTLGSAFSQTLSPRGTPPYTYSIVGGLPPGLMLLPSGEIQGTPNGVGVFSFTVLVTDANGGIASQTYTITVGTAGTSPVWSSLGPTPETSPNDPTNPANFNSGRVASIAVDPGDLNHWLIGAGNGGVWETHDAGGIWAPLTDGMPTLAIGAVAFAPSNSKVIYAGTGEATQNGFTKAGMGMLKSTDGGKTWNLIGAASLARASVRRVSVHPTNPDVVLAITSRGGFGRDSQENAPSPPPFGVLKSSDGGITWARTLAGQATALEIDSTNFNNQYAAIGDVRTGVFDDSPGSVLNGVYRSMDSGQTWVEVPGPWGASTASRAATGRVELAISHSNPNVLYASITAATNGGSSAQPLLGLYRTGNAWAATPTWVQIPIDPTGNGGYCGPAKCNYSHVISVDPSDENVLLAGGGERTEVWRCSKCGAAPVWTNIAAGSAVHPDFHAVSWADKRLIVGNDGGVWSLASSGGTWQSHNATLSTSMFFSAALHPTNPNFILGGLRDFSISLRTTTNPWLILPEPQGDPHGNPAGHREWGEAEVAISSRRPDTDWMAAHCCEGSISRTTDGAKSGLPADTGIDTTAIAFVAPVRKCPSNDDIFLMGTNRIWRTNNFFSAASPSWAANSPPSTFQYPFPNAIVYPGTILAIEFIPSDTSCNSYAYGVRGGQVKLTRDGGNTWTDLDPGRKLPPRPVNGLAFDPTNANVLYAALSSFDDATPGKPGHLFKTTDALATSPTWVDISPPLNQPFNVVRVDPLNTHLIYVGSDTGLWHSADDGATWIHDGLSVGLPNAPVYDIQINPVTGRTALFTYGRGAYFLGPGLPTSSAVNGATYFPGGLVPGSWASLAGTNLAGISGTWTDGDFAGSGGNLPTNLNGVQVIVNSVPAAVYYTSPTQINFQVPAVAVGAATVQVVRDGVPSNTIQTQVVSSSPGIFPIVVSGTNYPAGVFLDGSITGDPANGSGFRKARAGDVIQLYATGLAPSPAGTTVGFQALSGVTITIGSVTFPADAAGLVAPGEFQINFTIPRQFASMPEGNYPISIQVNGVSSPMNINSNPPAPLVLPVQNRP